MSLVNENQPDLSPQYAELIGDIFSEVMGKILNPQVIKEVCGEAITLSQLSALKYLYRHNGESSVTELAEGLSITTPAATKMVDRLEKRNWVTRKEDYKDHRVFHVRLTEHGQHIITKVRELRIARINQIIESMSLESRQALLQGLETFIHLALVDEKLSEMICQHCGTDSLDNCIINRSQAERITTESDTILCS